MGAQRVSHREKQIEVWSRNDDGNWSRSEARTGASAAIPSLQATLNVDTLYAVAEEPS